MDQHLPSGDESQRDDRYDELICDEHGHYHADTSDIEYDEHGNPTREQIKRWEEQDAAAAQKWLDEVNETIAEVRRERAAKIAAGIDPGPHLITVDVLRAAGALSDPASRRKSLGGGQEERQRGLFDDEDTAAAEQAASDDDDAESSE